MSAINHPALWAALQRSNTSEVFDQLFQNAKRTAVSSAIPGAAATTRHSQDETGKEGSSPCADTGTAGVSDLYPVTCEARYYDAASRILDEEEHPLAGNPHDNANELGALIQQWIHDALDNWEPK